jgi:HTH-type transcriptional regulator / antitoxin HigA
MPATISRKTPLAKLYGRDTDRYLDLLAKFPLRPIRREAELDAATEVIHELIDQDTRTVAEEDYLEVISQLVEQYEEVHYPLEEVPDAEMLAYLMEIQSRTQTDVARGAKIAASTVSEVLSGKRKLNRAQIGKLARYFHVEPGVFAFDG